MANSPPISKPASRLGFPPYIASILVSHADFNIARISVRPVRFPLRPLLLSEKCVSTVSVSFFYGRCAIRITLPLVVTRIDLPNACIDPYPHPSYSFYGRYKSIAYGKYAKFVMRNISLCIYIYRKCTVLTFRS